MCKWGTETEVTLWGGTSPTAKGEVHVDSCIADIVQALNDGGERTEASCCGHGKGPGLISMADGRQLVVLPNYKSLEKISIAF